MKPQVYYRLLQQLINFGILYMFLETIIHLSTIRLHGLDRHWPPSAVAFFEEFNLLWGIGSLTILWILINLRRHFNKSLFLLPQLIPFCLFWALILLYSSRHQLTQLQPTQLLTLYIPHYHWWLRLEALILILISLILFYGHSRQLFNASITSPTTRSGSSTGVK